MINSTNLSYQFCTYFDHRYLTRGLALYDSLVRHCPSFALHVLCLSETCYELLNAEDLPHAHLIRLAELEADEPDLLTVKPNRSTPEYYFTLTPFIIQFVLNKYPNDTLVTYLDADLFFFAHPGAIFDEIGTHSIAIVPHQFPPHLKWLEKFGKYNVGWLTFRDSQQGRECLTWYRDRCLEWCYDRLEEDRFADQKYLDYFESSFDGVVALIHKGVNLAPWNVDNYGITKRDARIYVDEDQVVFFHFHGLKKLAWRFYDTAFGRYRAHLNDTIKKELYSPYLKTLEEFDTKYSSQLNTLEAETLRGVHADLNSLIRRLIAVVAAVLRRSIMMS